MKYLCQGGISGGVSDLHFSFIPIVLVMLRISVSPTKLSSALGQHLLLPKQFHWCNSRSCIKWKNLQFWPNSICCGQCKPIIAIGDLYLIGHALLASYSAHKSGHGLNNQLLRALLAQPDAYEVVSFDSMELAPHSYLTQMAEQWLPN